MFLFQKIKARLQLKAQLCLEIWLFAQLKHTLFCRGDLVNKWEKRKLFAEQQLSKKKKPVVKKEAPKKTSKLAE